MAPLGPAPPTLQWSATRGASAKPEPSHGASLLAEVDVLVVGAGHAGLAMSYHLGRGGPGAPGGPPPRPAGRQLAGPVHV